MKLLSLFSGSGGFELAAAMCGITPVACSEVEPYPIAVTKSRFPNMKHLGNVMKINGAEIEPVDVLTFGFPCQDVSVAGKRAGIKHEDNGDDETTRSGLFWEAVRIIEEMRCATNGKYPRFAVFENVPGLFSADKGEAFRTVVEGLIKIVEPQATMPEVPKGGWAYADSYVGDGWSFAYRVFDAQYIRTAQRRRRVYAILDLGGQCARQILFERDRLRGNNPPCGKTGQGTAPDVERGVGADDREGVCYGFPLGFRPENVRLYDEKATTLCNGTRAGFCNGVVIEKEQHLFENHSQDSRYKGPLDVCPMLPAQLGTGGNNQPFVVEQTPFCKSHRASSADDATTWKHADKANTLNTFDIGEARVNELIVEPVPIHDKATRFTGKHGDKSDGKDNGLGVGNPGDPMNTLTGGDRHAVVYALDRASFNQGENAQYDFEITDSGVNSTIVAKGPRAVAYSFYPQMKAGSQCLSEEVANCVVNGTNPGFQNGVIESRPPHYIVRRLTPTECARLQGFPSIVEVDMNKITRDELCAIALSAGYIKVDTETGKVYGTRGPGGVERDTPVELKGSVVNGYTVYSIHAGGSKKQVRANRLVWIAANGSIPDGLVVDHINNDKSDNRICNLQLLTKEENSSKACADGCYKCGEEHPQSKLKECEKQAIYFLYWNTDKPYSHFAKMFGISDSRAQQIIHHKQYADIDHKDDFTDEEYEFWLDVRNTHAEINGKAVKDYTKKQMLTWYNKLHNDGAEYKMWGNGIALPCALFVMEGIAEALK